MGHGEHPLSLVALDNPVGERPRLQKRAPATLNFG
jgi:hypothetical protein